MASRLERLGAPGAAQSTAKIAVLQSGAWLANYAHWHWTMLAPACGIGGSITGGLVGQDTARLGLMIVSSWVLQGSSAPWG